MTALDVQVVAERGQWAVYLVRVTPQGADRELLTTRRSRGEAMLFADVVRRSAYRRHSLTEPSPTMTTTPPEGDCR